MNDATRIGRHPRLYTQGWRRLVLLLCLVSSTTLLRAEAIWIDVRSDREYQHDHIAGDLFVPHRKILEVAPKHVKSKDQPIFLYCAAGVRAEIARKQLVEAGYTQVTNAGGIEDARRARNIK